VNIRERFDRTNEFLQACGSGVSRSSAIAFSLIFLSKNYLILFGHTDLKFYILGIIIILSTMPITSFDRATIHSNSK
jgi:hypothetical protein